MSHRLPRRRIAIGLAVAAVATGVGIGIALGDGDEEPTPGATGTAAPERRAAGRREGEHGGGRPVPSRRPERRGAREIVATVTKLVEANERGDGATACRLLGLDAGRSRGLQALERCARAAAIDVGALPTSDELAIERAAASGARGTARLTGGATLSLTRVGGRWRVQGFRPASG